MTATQKQAALTLFRNIENMAYLLADAINDGACDDIDARDAGVLADGLEALEILIRRCKAEMSNG